MSARPDFRRLADEDLDLLVSRYIDGDLTPEEASELERHLAADPRARQRHAATLALIEKLQHLPAPEPPFALATRVSTQVAERSSGFGSVWHRFGIYPPPGAVAAAAAIVAVVLVAGVVFQGRLFGPRASSTVAEARKPKEDGPVHVFFQDESSSGSPRAAAPAPEAAERQRAKQEKTVGDESAVAGKMNEQAKSLDATQAAAEGKADKPADKEAEPKRRASEDSDRLAGAAGFAPEARKQPERALAESNVAPAAPAPAAAIAPRDEAAFSRSAAKPLAKEKDREKVATEARVERGASLQSSDVTVTLVLPPGSADEWRLVEAPKRALDAPVDATFRLSLDAAGRVVSVAQAARKDQGRADVERLLMGLRFERKAGLRDEREARRAEVDVRVVAR